MIDEAVRQTQAMIGPRGPVEGMLPGGMQLAQGLRAYNEGARTTTILPNGDAFFGSDIADPSTTTLSVFATSQIYNNEDIAAGDLLLGNNSDGFPNLKWDTATGQLQFRLGKTVTVLLDTDGTFKLGAWTVDSTKIYSDLLVLNGLTPAILMGAATGYLVGTGLFLGLSGGAYKFSVGNPASTYLAWNGITLSASGNWISGAALKKDLQQWTTDIVFSSTDADTVAWTSGTVRLSDGTTYAINPGNTGNMTALTYIYIDGSISANSFQTTNSYGTAVGEGKILIAAAQNHTAGASVVVLNGQQPILNGTDNIVAGSILAGQLAANSVVASNISVTNLAAISATMGALTVDNKLTMSGASSAITIGTTPPTSATVGTGLWIDRTGIYGLAASVQQAIFDAVTGKITAGAGKTWLNTAGLGFDVGTAYAAGGAVKWYTGSTLYSEIFGYNDVSYNYTQLEAYGINNKSTRVTLRATSQSTKNAEMYLIADKGDGVTIPSIILRTSGLGGQADIQLNGSQLNVDTIVMSQNVQKMLHVDASLDAVGIGGPAVSGRALTVVGDLAVDSGRFELSYISNLTIASDAITITGSHHAVDTEGGAATDNLSTINGGVAGQILILRTVSSARDVVVKNGTGNITCGADQTLSDVTDIIALMNFGGTAWRMLFFANNA